MIDADYADYAVFYKKEWIYLGTFLGDWDFWGCYNNKRGNLKRMEKRPI